MGSVIQGVQLPARHRRHRPARALWSEPAPSSWSWRWWWSTTTMWWWRRRWDSRRHVEGRCAAHVGRRRALCASDPTGTTTLSRTRYTPGPKRRPSTSTKPITSRRVPSGSTVPAVPTRDAPSGSSTTTRSAASMASASSVPVSMSAVSDPTARTRTTAAAAGNELGRPRRAGGASVVGGARTWRRSSRTDADHRSHQDDDAPPSSMTSQVS